MSEPIQKPARSKQNYETPQPFLDAVVKRFGPLAWDLACTPENAKAGYLGEDALAVDWVALEGNLWCNPPFGDIGRWTEKMARECVGRSSFTLLLVPASIGTSWFIDHCKGRAYTEGLSPRISFDGIAGYPKDLALIVWGFGLAGFGTWRWK